MSNALMIGEWYYSKRKHLCRIEKISSNVVEVTSHYTGHLCSIPLEDTKYLEKAPEPDTAPGTAIMETVEEDVKQYNSIYEKYPHVVEGSIYKVKNNIGNKDTEQTFKAEGKLRVKIKKGSVKGATRCKINCVACGTERDIKIQDAFQVRFCLECKKKIKKDKKFRELLIKKGILDG